MKNNLHSLIKKNRDKLRLIRNTIETKMGQAHSQANQLINNNSNQV
jgi:hypothetical protein